MSADWNVPTPEGFLYEEPTTLEGILQKSTTYVQSQFEHWNEDDVPPNPTWQMVGIVYKEVERLRKESEALRNRLHLIKGGAEMLAHQASYMKSSCSP